MTALFYLQLFSFWNRWVLRIRRLKQPKYLAGSIVAISYFYFFVFHGTFGHGRNQRAVLVEDIHEILGFIQIIGALALLVIFLVVWALPGDRAALAFTEAETSFLFPAPISRRKLIHFKLLKSQVQILFTSFLLTLLSGGFKPGGDAWIQITGLWLILSIIGLHSLGASFTCAILHERGLAVWIRRLGILAVAVALMAIFGQAIHYGPPWGLETFASFQNFARAIQETLKFGPIPYILYPFQRVAAPLFAHDITAFVRVCGPVLILLILHYAWVICAHVSFEEASIEAAQKNAERIAAIRQGNWSVRKAGQKKKTFPNLKPTGPKPIAFLWKNLIFTGLTFSLRFWIALAAIGMILGVWLKIKVSPAMAMAYCLFPPTLFVGSLIYGPLLLRFDLRQNLANIDILKMYPLPGWQVVFGELLSNILVLTVFQWYLLAFGVVFGLGPLGSSNIWNVSFLKRLIFGMAIAIILPVFNLIFFLIPNAAALFFPAWIQTSRIQTGGIEVMGQRMIGLFFMFLVLLLILVPAVVIAIGVGFGIYFLLGLVPSMGAASFAGGAVLAVEAALGLYFLGRQFERFDLSAETPVC